MPYRCMVKAMHVRKLWTLWTHRGGSIMKASLYLKTGLRRWVGCWPCFTVTWKCIKWEESNHWIKSGRTIQSNKHWSVAVIESAVKFGGTNQKPNIHNGRYKNTKQKEIQGKRSSCSEWKLWQFFYFAWQTMVGQGQMKDDIRMMASFMDNRIFTWPVLLILHPGSFL